MNHEKVKAYLTYMIDIAEALGINRAKAIPAFTEALELEIKLANVSIWSELDIGDSMLKKNHERESSDENGGWQFQLCF